MYPTYSKIQETTSNKQALHIWHSDRQRQSAWKTHRENMLCYKDARAQAFPCVLIVHLSPNFQLHITIAS